MKIIGICGSSGSGKSTVCKYFSECGIPVLDCDEIYHNLVEAPSDCLTEIGVQFGADLIENNRLNREKLGNIVFCDREKLALLNEISHRHVKIELEKLILAYANAGHKACIIDAPMLFEAQLDQRCDVVIAVICDETIQIDRICARDGIDAQRAKKRLMNQKSSEELKRLADYVLVNNGTCDDLIQQCRQLQNLILNEI